MVKTIIYCSDPVGEATTSGSQTFQSIIGEILDTTTENNHKYRCRSAGTLSQMYMRITAISGGTVVCKSRKNGADGGQTMSITGTGEWEDTSGTDSLDGDDEINYALNTAAAAQTITTTLIQMLFDATTNTVSLLGVRIANIFSTASTTFFRALSGNSTTGTPTEDNSNCRQRVSGTFKRIGVFVSSNARTESTLRSRKNDGNGNQSQAITASTTGWFEDTSNTDSVSAGDDFNFAWVHGTGTNNCTYQVMKIEFESTAGDGQIVNSLDTTQSVVDNTTRHFTLGGILNDTITAATNLRAETNVAIDFKQITILIPTNTASNTSTVTLQKDGADTTLIASVTADGTGNFTDTSNTVSFTAGQETSIEITVPTEGGTNVLTIKNISTWSNIAVASNLERSPETETVTISDTVARVYGQTRTIATETVTSSESIARMLAATRNPVETTTSAETLTRILAALRPITTETTTSSDSVARVRGVVRAPATETTTSSDSVARMLAANRTLAETTSISDSVTRLLAANRSLATETTSISDSVTRLVGVMRAPATETVTISDSVTRLLAATRTIQTESTVISDAVARLLAANRALLETTTITDSVVGLQQGPGQQNLTRSISETVVISDSVARMLAATRTIVTETVAINDILTRQTVATRAIDAEITSIIDTVQRSCGRVRTIATETVAVTDSVVRSVGRVRTITETVNVSDSVTRLLAATRQMLEQVSQLDSLSRLLAASRSIQTETVSVSDSVTRLLTRVRSIIENIDINDAITRAFVGARPILETIDITDTLTRVITPFDIPTRLKKIRQWLQAKYDIGDPAEDV